MKKNAIVFDIDGVLADISHRVHFIKDSPKQWKRFFEAGVNDKPIEDGVLLLKMLCQANMSHGKEQSDLLLMTGRSEEYRSLTVEWLEKQMVFDSCYARLLMRDSGDFRPDYIVKEELYENHVRPYYQVRAVFEDRSQVVKMWRSKGITCWQNCDGDY